MRRRDAKTPNFARIAPTQDEPRPEHRGVVATVEPAQNGYYQDAQRRQRQWVSPSRRLGVQAGKGEDNDDEIGEEPGEPGGNRHHRAAGQTPSVVNAHFDSAAPGLPNRRNIDPGVNEFHPLLRSEPPLRFERRAAANDDRSGGNLCCGKFDP